MSTSPNVPVRTRRVLWFAGAVAAASLATACGSTGAEPGQPAATPAASVPASSTPAQSPAASPSSAPAAAPSAPATSSPSAAPSAGAGGGAVLAMCRTASLRIILDDLQGGGAAGSAYYPLNFTNTSTAACELYGYPGVSFTAAPSSAGGQIGLAAQRNGAFGKVAVRLAPGATAHAWLQVTTAGNYPASACQPVTAQWLRVYPPGETVAGYVGHTFSACSSSSTALLTVLPVRAGAAVAEVTP
jgi:hypothetical protein